MAATSAGDAALLLLLVWLLSLMVLAQCQEQDHVLDIRSYNMQKLRTKKLRSLDNRDQILDDFLGKILVGGDIIHLQEIQELEVLHYIKLRLTLAWEISYELASKKGENLQEYFAFIYNTNRVELIFSCMFSLHKMEISPQGVFIRAPHVATFKSFGKLFTVVGVHLTSQVSVAERNLYKNQPIRRDSIKTNLNTEMLVALLSKLRFAQGDDYPFVVIGDFNYAPGLLDVSKLNRIEWLLDDSVLTLHGLQADKKNYRTGRSTGPADKIFVSGEMMGKVQDCGILRYALENPSAARFWSDHFPIYLRVAIGSLSDRSFMPVMSEFCLVKYIDGYDKLRGKLRGVRHVTSRLQPVAASPGQCPAPTHPEDQRPQTALEPQTFPVQGPAHRNLREQGLAPPNLQEQDLTHRNVQQGMASLTLQGQRPKHQNLQGQRPTHQNFQGQRPTHQNLQGQRPTHQNLQGQRPTHQNFQGQQPTHQNLQGQRPSHQNLQGQRPTHQNFQGQRPTHQNFQGQALVHQNLRDQQNQEQDTPSTRPMGTDMDRRQLSPMTYASILSGRRRTR